MRKVVVAFAIMAAMLFSAGLTWADGDDDDGEVFRTRLSGAEEVGPVATSTTGSFKIRFNEDETAAEYRLVVRDGVRVTQAHLHCAPAGSNGPVVVFLAGFHPVGWDVDGKWIGNATVTGANIVNTACGSSLSVLADSIPGGEVRGQFE